MLVLSGYALWNETDSLNSESQKLVHFFSGQFSSGETAGKETDLLEHELEGCSSKSFLNIPGPFRSMKEEDETQGKATSHQFWKEPPLTFFQQALWEVELLIFICNVAVVVAYQQFQVRVPVVGAETSRVSGEDWKERKEGEVKFLREEEERKDEFMKEGRLGQSVPIFCVRSRENLRHPHRL